VTLLHVEGNQYMTDWFAASLKVVVLAIATASFLIIAPELGEARKLQPCEKDHAKWKTRQTHKAVATSGGRPLAAPGTACGFSYGYPSKSAAISRALAECRITDRKFKYTGTCKIILVK